jgi:predicted O-methyltransferase YrrM
MTDGGSSIGPVRQLLATLVAAKPRGRIAELGTAFGEGASAMATELAADATLVTVENDPERFRVAAQKLAGTRVEMVLGDWRELLPERGPFDLIFLDAGDAANSAALAISMLADGGILVKDDLTPGSGSEGDPVREALLNDPRVVASEIQTTPTTAAIIAVRRSS